MAEDWVSISAEVALELGDVGTTAYIIRQGASGGTATNPTPGTTTEHACSVVYETWNTRQIDGEVIRMTDQKVLCSVTDIVPQVGDKFAEQSGGPAKTIVAPVMRLAPGGVNIMYELNVRG